MINDDILKNFLRDVALKMEKIEEQTEYFHKRKKLEELLDYCKNNQLTNIPEINVISTCMVEILSEIDEYLDYYDEEIEKSFGVQSIHEWSRIHNEVIKEINIDQ
ncbi:MAG: hypothetical protein ACE5KT_09820 [Methanosarcinales archaeon]